MRSTVVGALCDEVTVDVDAAGVTRSVPLVQLASTTSAGATTPDTATLDKTVRMDMDPDPRRSSPDDVWLVGLVANDGALAGLRVLRTGVPGVGDPARPTRVGVRLRFSGTSTSGFPDADVSAALLATEERLVGAVGGAAAFVAAVTAPGFRDLVFYTSVPEQVLAAVEATAVDPPLGEVRVDVDDDPAWRHYRALRADATVGDDDRRRLADVIDPSSDDVPEATLIHRFSFPDPVSADQARFAFATVGVAATRMTAAEGGDATDLEVEEVETLTQAELARSRDALSAFAVGHGGRYLGWRPAAPPTA